MLRSIFIDNYALIDKLTVDFEKGLSIVTGETGAGKTILLGALSLLLGKRADTSILKDQERKCIVEGEFSIDGYGLESFFTENDLEYHVDTVIRREIANNGKSRAFINDTPVNLDVLQELSLYLIDIHSQHQNLLLNSENYLRWIIDSYAGTILLAEDFKKSFHEYSKLKRRYEEAKSIYEKDKQELDYITHQFTELHEAKITEGEIELLEQEFDMLTHVEELKTGFENSSQLLESDQGGIISDLKQLLDILFKIKSHYPAAENTWKRLEGAYIEVKDLGNEIAGFNEKIEFDPIRSEQVKERIDFLYTLIRKYKVVTEKELIGIYNQLDNRLQAHSTGDFELDKLAKDLQIREASINEKANQLSEARKNTFIRFQDQVSSLLQTLGMSNAGFSIQWQPTDLTEFGIDKIQFLFASNKNISLQNIAKIASGGELSRLMLTIKYLISDSSGLPTVIFDEIDTGVSGEIADKVGNLIRLMSEKMQVINITHLPQVASKGDRHYLVYKDSVDTTVKTTIRLLSQEERLHEIAKMLSGDSITEAAIENARVLLGR